MKAYRVELLIVDSDNLGDEDIKEVIEETRYPNRCISPEVMSIEGKDIGEWHDEHPLNQLSTSKEYYTQLFYGGKK